MQVRFAWQDEEEHADLTGILELSSHLPGLKMRVM